jgi:hypothetical protein
MKKAPSDGGLEVNLTPSLNTSGWRALLPQLQELSLLSCGDKRRTIAGWYTAAYDPQKIADLGEPTTIRSTHNGTIRQLLPDQWRDPSEVDLKGIERAAELWEVA